VTEDVAKDMPFWWTAIAPISGGDSPKLDIWLAEAAKGMPDMAWTVGGDWSKDAAKCDGALDCLIAKAQAAGASYLMAPVYNSSDQRLQIRGVHLGQGAAIGEAALLVPEDRADAGPALLGAVFTALGVRPDVDLMKASKGASAVVKAPQAEPEPEPEPEPEVVAAATTPAVKAPPPKPAEEASPEVPKAPAPSPSPQAKSPIKVTKSSKPTQKKPTQKTERVFSRTMPKLSYERSRGTLIALGFVPVPGLTSAYLGDVPGFLVSLTGTVTLSALSVYTLGSTVRWRNPLVASSVLVPYAINVLFNEISGLVGWKRLYGNASIAQARRPVAGIAPVFAQDGKAPTGATFTVGGRF